MKNEVFFNRIFAILSVILVISCNNDDKKNVVADFTTSETEVKTGDTIFFINQSENASHYVWNFGDEDISIVKNPHHVYSVGGDYDVQLVASGEGGVDSAFVSISVSTAYNISIYEGEGIEGVDLYDTWSKIKAVYTSDTLFKIYDYSEDFGVYLQYVYYYEEGIMFGFITETTKLKSTDPVYYIYLRSPYEGATSKGISIGSNISDVISQYGNPESKDNDDNYEGYYYDTKGIDFYTEAGSKFVDEIDIYEPYETTKSTFKKANIRNIIMKERHKSSLVR